MAKKTTKNETDEERFPQLVKEMLNQIGRAHV